MQHIFSSDLRRSFHRLTRRARACFAGMALLAALTTAAQAGITQLGSQSSQYSTSNTLANFTVQAGGNRLLVVTAGDPSNKTPPSTVTFNGSAMSLANSTSDNSVACDAIFYYKVPGTAAATGDIVVTFADTGNNHYISAVAFSGVDQTNPVDTNGPKISGSVTTTGDSLVVSSQTGSLVFDHCDTWRSDAQATESPSASQTLISDAGGVITGGGGYGRYQTSTQPGASSVTMSWTGNAQAILHLTMNIHPAQISWGTATNISGDTDVSTTGSLVGAFVFGDTGVGSTTVNGVTFQGFAFPNGSSSPVTSGNFTVGTSGATGYTNAGAGSTSAPFTGLSSGYQALVGGKPLSSGGNITITMAGLTPGATYAVQFWTNGSSASLVPRNNPIVYDDGAGSSVSMSSNKTNTVGDLGQYAIGTFVASGTSQTLSVSSAALGRFTNAFQLRQTAAAPGAPTVTGISPASGSTAGGTAVTITGTGFTGVTGVTIGGTAATGVSLVSDTSITCTTPAGTAGTASVLVTNPSGTNTANTLYTYLAPPVAVADGVSPLYSTPVNQQFGRTAPGVLGNDTLNGGSISSYGASTGAEQTTIGSAASTAQGGTIVLNANGSFTYTPPASYSGNDTFKYKLTNGGGSSTATVTIYVDVLPTVSSTVPANNATGVALNSTITINFSEAISTTAAFTVTDTTASSSVAFTQSPTDGNTTTAFTLTPTSALAAGHVITVTVLHYQTADSDAGLSMQSDYVFSFATSPPPVAVNDPDTQGTRYQVVSGVLFDSALSGSPSSILANDTVNSGSLTYGATGPSSNTAVDGTTTITTSNGGTVLLRANGTFTYTSAGGYAGNDNFFYNLTNAVGSSRAQVLFKVNAVPTVTSISPSLGPLAGGTSVVITGTNFTGTTGAAGVKFGATNATSYTVDSATQITATTPASASAGTVDVTVTNSGGTSAINANDQFIYYPLPTVTGISPSTGPVAGGTVVTITGTNLLGNTSVKFGSASATNILPSGDGKSVTATSPAGTGTVDVTVSTYGGTSATSAADQFSYASPDLTVSEGHSPTTFLAGQTGTLTFAVSNTGTAATTGTITFSCPMPTGLTITSVATDVTWDFTATTSTQLTGSRTTALGAGVTAANITVSVSVAGNAPASVTPTATVGGGGQSNTSNDSGSDTITVIQAPTITSISPTSGPAAGGTSVTITGTNFTGTTGAAGVKFGSTNATSYTVNSNTQITATSPAGTGTVDVTVTAPSGTSATSAADRFSYLSATQAIASVALTQNKAVTAFTPVTSSGGVATISYGVSPALPSGLSFSTSTGAITGTPTVTSAASTYTVTVTDGNSVTASQTFSLTVNSAVTATQAIPSKTLTQNQPSANFTPVTGGGGTGTLSYGVSPALPAGLTLSTSTGAITGVPTVTSSATTYTVTVTDSNSASASNTFSLTINSAVTATQAIASKTLTQNQPSANFTPVTGGSGTTPLSYGVSPALPTGLSFSTSTGAITGSPTVTSSATTYTVTVTDANSATASNTFSLTINSAVTATQSVASTTLAQNQVATSFTPVTGGSGTPALSYGISPALPTGLTLNTSTGAITGTPTVASSTTTYTVTVTDSNGATASNTFSLTVNPGVSIAATTATAVEGGTTGVYTFTRGNSSGDLTVNFQLDASSTATAGTDFTLSSTQTLTFSTSSGAGTLVIPNGSSTATITLTALVESPNPAEAAETVRLNLSAGTGYAVNASPADNATVTIATNSFYVTTTSDSGTGSLRQALLNVNTLGGTPTVTFSDGTGGTVNFTDATPDTITLTSGEMQVTSSLVIAGPGANKLTIDGNGARILNLASISSYAISGINFVNGSGNGGSAILSQTFGVPCAGSVVGCSFSQHTTNSFGGAIFHHALSGVTSTMDVIGCSFAQNSSAGGGAIGVQGGGGAGGGSAVLRVTNCTFSQNSATYGGSIYSWGQSGTSTATIINSTFAGGSSTNDGADLLADQNGTIQVGNSILDSTGAAVAAINGGSLVSLGHNITAGATGPDDHSTDLLSTDPQISTLANNGGTTLTMALSNGSPAINAGSNALLPADTYDLNANSNTAEAIPFDQRGTGFPRVQGTTVDIGAFEALLYTPTLSATTTNEDTQSSSGLVITANTADAGGTANYKITGITGGTLYKNDGTSSISSGDYITKAEGAAGLKFSPSADAFSPSTTFGFNVQAALSATDSDLRGSVVAASITVNPVADTPSVTGSATTQNIQSVSGLVISRNDVDGSEVAYFKISNIVNGTLYLNDGTTAVSAGDFITYAQGSAGLKFTPALDFTGVASFEVQGSIDNAGTGLSGTATASIAVGTVNPTPTQLVPTDPVTGNPLPPGSSYPVISQTGTLEVRVSIKNTTAFPINGFRLSVDYSAYLATLPSLRLYNSTSAPGVVPAYIDYPFPVAVGDTVSLKLQFYTSTRKLPDPFSPPLSVTKLSASEVSSTDGSGVQPRIYSLSNGRILLEWDSTPGHWYRVKYSSDLVNWYDSPVPVQAPANRTQWVDDGAPFTDVPPSSVPSRYYRVNEISAPTP